MINEGSTVKIIGHVNDSSYYGIGALLFNYGIVTKKINEDYVELEMENGEIVPYINVRCLEKMNFPLVNTNSRIAFIMYPTGHSKNASDQSIGVSICHRLFIVKSTSQLDFLIKKIKEENEIRNNILFSVNLLDSQKAEDLFYYENGFKPNDDQLLSFLSDKIKGDYERNVENTLSNRNFH